MPDPFDTVGWRSWGREAFARAEAERKPVLLSVGVSWSLGCAAMLRTTYRDATVQRLVDQHFIPIWVDADERPDINDRYSLGGWPTTAFLTPDGQLLGGQTFTEPAPMAKLLERVAEAFAARQADLAARPDASASTRPERARRSPVEGGPLDLALDAWLVTHLQETFDETHGGFGRAAKRIQEAPLSWVLNRLRDGDAALRPMVTGTLDALADGPLFDQVQGGVFRFSERRDWGRPNVEKLLGVNASAVRLFLDGWDVTRESRYRDRAVAIIQYVGATLSDRDHDGFWASQSADDVYYQADLDDRKQLEPPHVDHVVYAGANADMARAYIQAAHQLNEAELLTYAVATLERVVGETYRRGQGVGHRVDAPDDVRGLLVDQVLVGEALVDAFRATDRDVYLDLAQELMLFSMRYLWDDGAGVFVDRVVAPDDIGLLRHTINPFELNCRAARLLGRLSQEAGRSDFGERARVALSSQTAVARSHSVDAAWYALALRDVGFSETS